MVAVLVAPFSTLLVSAAVALLFAGGGGGFIALGWTLFYGTRVVILAYPMTLFYYVPVYLVVKGNYGRNIESFLLFMLCASLGGAFILYVLILGVVAGYDLVFIVVSMWVSSITALFFWALAKPRLPKAIDDEENIRYVAKYLANPVRAGEYAVSKGISEEEVDRLAREGKLEAYSYKKQLYVSDT